MELVAHAPITFTPHGEEVEYPILSTGSLFTAIPTDTWGLIRNEPMRLFIEIDPPIHVSNNEAWFKCHGADRDGLVADFFQGASNEAPVDCDAVKDRPGHKVGD